MVGGGGELGDLGIWGTFQAEGVVKVKTLSVGEGEGSRSRGVAARQGLARGVAAATSGSAASLPRGASSATSSASAAELPDQIKNGILSFRRRVIHYKYLYPICRRGKRYGWSLEDLPEEVNFEVCFEGEAAVEHPDYSGKKTNSKKMKFLLFAFVGVIHLLSFGSGKAVYKNGISRRTFQEIKEEIAGYEDVAKAIINLAVYGKAQNRSYERLALLVDTVGPRLSGSKNLEKAIQIMYQNLQQNGLENVHLEPVKIPHWERGEESAVMLAPRIHKMAIMGLGSSIGTPPEGITAEVLVVTSFDELQRRAPEARGKIVVYNQPYISYAMTVQYRIRGAVEAAKVGALASLIRSVASFSIYSPHTGIQEYQDGVPRIPTACITVEDAEMMSRMASNGNTIVIQLKMGAKTYPDTDSFNTVAEITGSKYPEQVHEGVGWVVWE
ncbi:Carboxypeptidase Q [Sciurus carolinensis]|uniref:Carboxypeptidase Q n=1 Tax=Sciurus carolinensis TaxID=30640 RepID=A0AA41MUG0_SCICA|nr:Carboxypeptidase Q [Sciurus carolinensis]